jgi:hypothetical protein
VDEVLKDLFNARVFGRAKIHVVKDLWLQEIPAQPRAPRLSMEKSESHEVQPISTVENDEEKLAPASLQGSRLHHWPPSLYDGRWPVSAAVKVVGGREKENMIMIGW